LVKNQVFFTEKLLHQVSMLGDLESCVFMD